jgi:Uma2 family endonuclease
MNLLIRPPKTLMTADEFFDFVNRPENEARCFELVRGEVIEVSRPTRPHGSLCANFSRILGNYAFARKKGYVTTNDSGVVLDRDPDTVRGPDIAYYEDAERFEDLPEKWGDTAPRLIVEILSPNDTAPYAIRKITDFLNNGVEIAWIVDPEARTITVYTAKNGPKVLTEKNVLTGGHVLPGFRCKVADFFYLPEATKKPAKPKRKRPS